MRLEPCMEAELWGQVTARAKVQVPGLLACATPRRLPASSRAEGARADRARHCGAAFRSRMGAGSSPPESLQALSGVHRLPPTSAPAARLPAPLPAEVAPTMRGSAPPPPLRGERGSQAATLAASPAAGPAAARSVARPEAAARRPDGGARLRLRPSPGRRCSSRRRLALPQSRGWRCAAPGRCRAAGAPGRTWPSPSGCALRSSAPGSPRPR
mmetsp:Transcript_8186/g.26034  ORF Transcript_8186/g.26034 Transcript_8186/m.26034 type:complete len:213 (-) Transcript_8186:776-1414(-)